MQTTDWYGLYGQGWQGLITSESFAHPAKFSRKLIFRIFEHLIEEGLIKPGGIVLDCFAGVGLGALPAMQNGLHWIGVELEEKFVNLGQQNIEFWNRRFSKLPNWGTARLLRGDSRRLVELVGEVGGMIGSPPFGKAQMGGGISAAMRGEGNYKLTTRLPGNLYQPAEHSTDPANLGNMPSGDVDVVISSPPYVGSDVSSNGQRGIGSGMYDGDNDRIADKRQQDRKISPDGYGVSDGQLGNMPAGSLEACVSSPPFADSEVVCQDTGDKRDVTDGSWRNMGEGYGHTPGQLAAMPTGVVSSPPYEGSIPRDGRGTNLKIHKQLEEKYNRRYTERSFPPDTYGNSEGQLGLDAGDTFWSAAHTIVSQVYQILAPGSPCVWVVKRFVRNKAIVEFSQQWLDLCLSVGFQLLHWHKAFLVEDSGSQLDLFGGEQRKVKKRYSFFRRLHASRYPHLEIQWEDVICMVKPV